jgi:hypothetical protein
MRRVSGGTDVYLLDTNIFLERLLKQDESASVQALLSNKDPADLQIPSQQVDHHQG